MSSAVRRILGEVLSLEDLADGNMARELEYTFYGQLANPAQLEEKSFKKEKQEQWLIPVDTKVKGKIRIRRIDDKQCVITTKVKRVGLKGQEEVECDISNDMFEHMKLMGTGGYIKTRYYFKIPNTDMVWEIDVFKNSLGEDHDWVKIDLEVKGELSQFPKLPVDFIQVITHQAKEQTVEEKNQIDDLWKKQWASLDGQ